MKINMTSIGTNLLIKALIALSIYLSFLDTIRLMKKETRNTVTSIT